MPLDQSEANRALARVFAYMKCGKPELARGWADQLRRMLEEAGL